MEATRVVITKERSRRSQLLVIVPSRWRVVIAELLQMKVCPQAELIVQDMCPFIRPLAIQLELEPPQPAAPLAQWRAN